MSDVFFSYVEEDSQIALALADGLNRQGFSTWCYERDGKAAVSYLDQIYRQLENAKTVVVVISPQSVKSHQVDREVIQAHELKKAFIPILHSLTYAELQKLKPGWCLVLGATTAITLPPGGTAAAISKMAEALREFDIEAGEPVSQAGRDDVRDKRGASSESRWAWPKPIAFLVAVALVSLAVAIFVVRRQPPPADGPIVVGVMEIHPRGRVPGWMCDFSRDGLNTVLSKVDRLRVFSQQKIDFIREQRKLKEIEVAEQLQIGKMISGWIANADSRVMLEVQVVDIKSGMLDDTERVEGSEDELVSLLNQVTLALVRKLASPVTDDALQQLVKDRTNDTLKSYKRFTETLDAFTGTFDEPSQPKGGHDKGAWQIDWTATAYAQGADADDVRAILEQYREALEAKDIDRLAAVHVAMSDAQREAMTRYFKGVSELSVKFTDVDVQVEGEKALATFTRNDYFKDAETGRETHLEVRLSSEMAKQKEGWRIRGLKKPS
jgi:TolB-like protein/ketosteroid isomerase-like protein